MEMAITAAKRLEISKSTAYRYVGNYNRRYHIIEGKKGQFKKCA